LPTVAGTGYLDDPGEAGLGAFDVPPRGRPGTRLRLLTAATIAAVAVLAGVAIFIIRHPGGKPGHQPSPVPGGSHGAVTQAAGPPAGSHPASGPARQGAISTALIFPHAEVAADGIRFRRIVAVLDQPCAAAARSAFATALDAAGCQRVARATFTGSGGQYAVTVGVAQLSGYTGASSAARSGRFGPDVWFVGLDGPAKSGATAVSSSVGVGDQVVYGQYIVYALATYGDGRNPTGHMAEVKTLTALARSFAAIARRPLVSPAR
jgi:hypothetical protein